MICEPCGKNIVYHPSAACRECYMAALGREKRLREENNRLKDKILEAATSLSDAGDHVGDIIAMKYLEAALYKLDEALEGRRE